MPRNVKMERSLNAPADHVYKVLTDARHIPNWYGPSDDFKVTVHKWEPKVGGKYRVEFNAPDGETNIVVGEFKELVPGKKVAYTWTWEGRPVIDTLVTIVLKPNGKKTDLTLTHEGFPSDDMADHHNQGWTGSMERLMRAVLAATK
jgi:uncharacterized protein YndB with AHSA1/START domain